MSVERVRSFKVTITVETNERTIEREFDCTESVGNAIEDTETLEGMLDNLYYNSRMLDTWIDRFMAAK